MVLKRQLDGVAECPPRKIKATRQPSLAEIASRQSQLTFPRSFAPSECSSESGGTSTAASSNSFATNAIENEPNIIPLQNLADPAATQLEPEMTTLAIFLEPPVDEDNEQMPELEPPEFGKIPAYEEAVEAMDKAIAAQSVDAFLKNSADIFIDEEDQSDFMECMRLAADKAETEDDATLKFDPLEERSADTGEFDVRDKVGQKFSRSHEEGTPQGDSYRIMTMAEKRVSQKLGQGDIQAHHRPEVANGLAQANRRRVGRVLYTEGGLVLSYGGWKWKPAIQGAKRHFAKACRMGGKWVTKDSMSGLMHVMKLRHIHREIMHKK